MQRTDVFLKIELRLDNSDDPKKVAQELCKQLMKSYGVRSVEISNLVEKD